jgi:hypothetical protein
LGVIRWFLLSVKVWKEFALNGIIPTLKQTVTAVKLTALISMRGSDRYKFLVGGNHSL